MNFDTTLKGFQNPTGHNNCFLNVGLQSLWHLAPFHLQFVACKAHFHDHECCLFCSLKLIFDQYKYGDSNTLPPTVIRNDLSFLFAKDSKFQVGQLDDAAEALESLLSTLHNQLTQGTRTTKDAPDATCEPPCLVHRVFGIGVVQQTCCPNCAATSEPFVSNALIDYIPVAALRAAAHESSLTSPRPSSFAELLRRARSGHDLRKCTNEECGKQAPLLQYLITRPAVYSVGLVWESDETPMGDIMSTLELIGQDLDTWGLYHQSEGEQCQYKLKGMVCYYGKHYIAYFYSASRGCWIGFDDVIVTEVGPHWGNVLSKCKRGKDQPALLFYEKVDYSSPFDKSPASTPNSTPRGVHENGVGNGTNSSSISPRNENGNGVGSRQVYENEGYGTQNVVDTGDLINFSAPPPSQTRSVQAPTYAPLAPYYPYTSPQSSDLYAPTRHEELSLGHRLTSKISQKIHGTSSASSHSYGLSSLAPSARVSTVHTPSYATPASYATPSYAAPSSYTIAPYTPNTSYATPNNTNYATSNPSYSISNNYSTVNPSPIYYRSTSTTSTPTTSAFTPASTTSSPSSVTSLRNGSPQRARPDPFSSLLANSFPSSPTRTPAASQRPPDPTPYQSTTTRNPSPSHQRPLQTSTYVSPSSRGTSPSHSRPTESTSSSVTRGLSPSHQRPLDYYSRGLSASRTSAYPPAPTLNSTSSTRGTSLSQRPTYDHTMYSTTPARAAPDPSTHATQPTSAARGVSPARRPTDPSPTASYYSTTNGKLARNPSPARSQVSSSTTTSPIRTQLPSTTTSTISASSRSQIPSSSSTIASTRTQVPPTTPSTASIMAKFARPPARASDFSSQLPGRVEPPSSIYSHMDKSSYSSSKYYPNESLDREVESFLQNMRLTDSPVKPIPTSAPPPRYTSPKRIYPSDANYTSYGQGFREINGTISGKQSPSSLFKGSPPGSAKKSVTFQT